VNTFKHKKHIANKFDSFKNLIDTLGIPFQIIGLTETWLKGYEYIGPNRPKKRGGGVGIYVTKQLKYKSRIDLTRNLEDIIETKFIEVTNNNGKNFIIGVIYRPPNSNFDTFPEEIKICFWY
jgi:exonuclease III